jgi:endonuclease/exonuclease/phosphatase family metal-dependent hydrolase
MIKILTLNLWRYYDFEIRLPNIVEVIKNNNIDVVFMQEVQTDESFSSFSQVEIIKKYLPEYKYSLHSVVYKKTSQQGKELLKPIQHGMAILSKYPIVNSFEYYVTQNQGEIEPRSILCFDVEINTKLYKLANIHFANKEDWAKKQFEEFMQFLFSRNEKRIMAGDFNMFNLSEYREIFPGYKISTDVKNYVSFPKDNYCLDYILIPDEFDFQDFQVLEEYLSDHKGLIGEIE